MRPFVLSLDGISSLTLNCTAEATVVDESFSLPFFCMYLSNDDCRRQQGQRGGKDINVSVHCAEFVLGKIGRANEHESPSAYPQCSSLAANTQCLLQPTVVTLSSIVQPFA